MDVSVSGMHLRTRADPPERFVAARAVAAARLAVLLAVAAAGAWTPDAAGRTQAFYLLVGLVAVPWAIVVLFAVESERRAVAGSGWLADLLTVFALQVLLPERGRLALVLSVAVLVAAGYLVRSVLPRVIAGVAVALTLASRLVSGSDAGTNDVLLYVAIVAVVAIVAERVDVDRRRAAAWAHRLEGRSSAILDKVADAVVLTDGAGNLRALNPAARRLFGGNAAGSCTDVLRLHEGERPLDCAGGCALLNGLHDGDGTRVWRPLPDGRRQPLLASAAQVDGGAEVVHSVRDITKLVEADEAKTLFLATASHELKTPLTVITGFTSTLLRKPDLDPDTQRTALTAIHQRAGELSKIVDRLLMSSRIEAGRLSMPLEAVDVAGIVRDRAGAVPGATGRDVRLDVADDLPAGFANADAVATVVDHLVDNALKYAPEGTVVVRVDKDADRVTIVIADDGVGMDAEQAERCFEKFWQADTGDARRFGGTGIGLYIVKSLVDAMSGTVTVRSEPGAGAEFTVSLPTEDVRAASEVPAQRSGESSMIREFMRQIGVPDDRSTA